MKLPALALLAELDTPEKIQTFIDQKISYDPDREDRSVAQVIADKKAECLNGALFAVACLQAHGYTASIVELLARAGDEEHVLCVYKQHGHYGSIAQSKFLGLKDRQPMYRSLHDLVASYLEFYFGFDGRYSLVSYSSWFGLSKYRHKWLHQSEVVKQIAKDLRQSPHHILINSNDPYYLVKPERYWKEVLFIPPRTTIPQMYLAHKLK